MVLPPSGDVGNVDALFRAPENIGKSLKEIFCWLLKQQQKKLSAATRSSGGEKKEGGGVKWSRVERKRKKCFTILFMILSSKSELLKCSQDLS